MGSVTSKDEEDQNVVVRNSNVVGGCNRPNYLWTGIIILMAILMFLMFVKSCKGSR